ncbi:hypothetical protein ACYSNR_12830 [Enterococcus sp. LJL128]
MNSKIIIFTNFIFLITLLSACAGSVNNTIEEINYFQVYSSDYYVESVMVDPESNRGVDSSPEHAFYLEDEKLPYYDGELVYDRYKIDGELFLKLNKKYYFQALMSLKLEKKQIEKNNKRLELTDEEEMKLFTSQGNLMFEENPLATIDKIVITFDEKYRPNKITSYVKEETEYMNFEITYISAQKFDSMMREVKKDMRNYEKDSDEVEKKEKGYE